MIKHWTSKELATLRAMRARFLDGTAGRADYWCSPEDLALYDATYAERIGWKWDAVLRELKLRDWQPRSRRVLDWGCGSGVAGRRAIAAWPRLETLALHDRSARAVRFAAERAPSGVRMEMNERVDADTLLVLSHVINELSAPALARVLDLAQQAGEVMWVEAGTHADSRRLIAVREALALPVVAPCTHRRACGLLTRRNERHWCHFFAHPPPAIFQDARWMAFGRELGIDLRSLPYSFLVLQRAAAPPADGLSRILGAPRDAKGYSRVLSCQAEGVAEFMLQKRDAPALLREVREAPEPPVFRWTLADGKIVAGEKLA